MVVDGSHEGLTRNAAIAPSRQRSANDRAPLILVALPEEFCDRCERLDMVAEDLERREQRHREERTEDFPHPEPEREPEASVTARRRAPITAARRIRDADRIITNPDG